MRCWLKVSEGADGRERAEREQGICFKMRLPLNHFATAFLCPSSPRSDLWKRFPIQNVNISLSFLISFCKRRKRSLYSSSLPSILFSPSENHTVSFTLQNSHTRPSDARVFICPQFAACVTWTTFHFEETRTVC